MAAKRQHLRSGGRSWEGTVKILWLSLSAVDEEGAERPCLIATSAPHGDPRPSPYLQRVSTRKSTVSAWRRWYNTTVPTSSQPAGCMGSASAQVTTRRHGHMDRLGKRLGAASGSLPFRHRLREPVGCGVPAAAARARTKLGSKLGNQGRAADSIPSPVFPVGKRALVTLEQRQPVTRRIRVVSGVSRSTRRSPRHESWRETAIFCCGPVITKSQACEEREGFCAWRLSQASATQRRDRAGQPCISGGCCPDRQAVTVDGVPPPHGGGGQLQ